MKDTTAGIFTTRHIALAAFLGGPATAGLMIARNYHILGRRGAAIHAVFSGIILEILLLWLLVWHSSPAIMNAPLYLVASVVSLIILLLTEKLQGRAIREYIRGGGHPAHLAHILLFLVTGMVAEIAIVLMVMAPLPDNNPDVKKVKLHEDDIMIEYSDSLVSPLPDSLIDFFNETRILAFFSGEHFRLTDEGPFYMFSLIARDNSWVEDELMAEDLYTLQEVLNAHFHFSKPLVSGIYVPDSGGLFTTRKPKHFFLSPAKDTNRLLLYPINNQQKIYYTRDVPEKDVEILAGAIGRLKQYFPADEHLEIILTKWLNSYEIKYLFGMARWEDRFLLERLKNTGAYVQHAGLSGPLSISVCDMRAHHEKMLLELPEDTLMEYDDAIMDYDLSKPLRVSRK